MNRVMRKLALLALPVCSLGVTLGAPLVASSQAVSNSMESASSVRPPSTASGAIQPAQPAENTPDSILNPGTLIPKLPPLPSTKATLVGGIVERVDRVQDQVTIRVFGGGKVKAFFDPRTRIYRGGHPESIAGLKKGERVYADTILVDDQVFARNIRLRGSASEGEGQGVVVSFQPDSGVLVLHDPLSPEPLDLQLASSTRVIRAGRMASAHDLVAGTLIAVKFQAEGGHVIAREVSILITPGTEFTFSGRVTSLDLHLGLLEVNSSIDRRTYEIFIDSSDFPVTQDLREGSEVSVLTRYDGNRYVARGLTIDAAFGK